MAEKFGFYERIACSTRPSRGPTWDEAPGRWTVKTDRGDAMRARYVVLANGILTTPKLARIKGMETFQGEAFHTSRWNYNVDLAGKRVGIIGTGRDRRAGHARTRQGRGAAVRLPAHALDHRRARPAGDDAGGDTRRGDRSRAGRVRGGSGSP